MSDHYSIDVASDVIEWIGKISQNTGIKAAERQYFLADEIKSSLEKHHPEITGDDYLRCQFCYDSGFDRCGLKTHLIRGECEEFNKEEIAP